VLPARRRAPCALVFAPGRTRIAPADSKASLVYLNDQVYQRQRHPEQIYDETECIDDWVSLVTEPTTSPPIYSAATPALAPAPPLRSSRRDDGATMEARLGAGP